MPRQRGDGAPRQTNSIGFVATWGAGPRLQPRIFVQTDLSHEYIDQNYGGCGSTRVKRLPNGHRSIVIQDASRWPHPWQVLVKAVRRDRESGNYC
jgi:hypothetical protein